MAKFVFKLQPLLNIKSQMEDSLKNELGKAIRRLEKEKEILRGLEAGMSDSIDRFNSKSAKGILVGELREYSAFISHLKGSMELQKENINNARINADNIRGLLIKATQEKEMLEKLKESKRQEFLKEEKKQEQKLYDEYISFIQKKNNAEEKNGR